MNRIISLTILLSLFCFSLKSNVISYEVFEDQKRDLSYSDITSRDLKWVNDISKIENISSSYWVRFKVELSEEKRVLEVVTPQTEEVTFYCIGKGQSVIEHKTGLLREFESRQYRHKNFVFDLPGDYSGWVYLKIKSANKVGFVFKIYSNRAFSAYSLQEYLLLGIYYGGLLVLGIYHFILFLVVKRKLYLFFVLSIVFAALNSASDDGFGVIYIWPILAKHSQQIGLYFLPLGYLLSFTLYAASFLLKTHQQWKNVIFASTGLYIFFWLGSGLLSEEQSYFSSFYAIPFIVIYVVFVLVRVKESFKPAGFFIAGFSWSLFGILIYQLRLLGVLDGNILTVYAFNVGVFLEFMSLSLSIGYRFKVVNRAKKLAQEGELKLLKEKNATHLLMLQAIKEKEQVTAEINKTLELKVEERTSQLNDLVAKLKTLNLDYDKENWALRRSVKAEKQKQFLGEKISYRELRQIYPNNYQCLKYLADLKWTSDDFKCEKCGNNKFSTKQDTFARKCSKCSASFSPTRKSVFQAQKIDLNKLFYIAYLFFENESINVKMVATDLQISEASVYNFVKKLKQKKQAKIKSNSLLNSWVDLIF